MSEPPNRNLRYLPYWTPGVSSHRDGIDDRINHLVPRHLSGSLCPNPSTPNLALRRSIRRGDSTPGSCLTCVFLQLSTQFPITPWRGSTAIQHSGFTSFARAPSARPRNTPAWSYPQLPVQTSVGQGPMYQGTTRGGSSGAQMPFIFPNVPRPPAINTMPVNPPPHSGEPRSFPPVYNVR
jgi:hypothetical protein